MSSGSITEDGNDRNKSTDNLLLSKPDFSADIKLEIESDLQEKRSSGENKIRAFSIDGELEFKPGLSREISLSDLKDTSKRWSAFSGNYSSKHLPSGVPLSPKRVSAHTFLFPHPLDMMKHVEPRYREIDEFNQKFYTPICEDPEVFGEKKSGYKLRQNIMGRHTELLIAITLYNESDVFLIRTLLSVLKNLKYFDDLSRYQSDDSRRESVSSRNNKAPKEKADSRSDPESGTSYAAPTTDEKVARGDGVWNKDTWQKIVVCIICDGRSKVDSRVLLILEQMGIFDPNIIMERCQDFSNSEKSHPVKCHLFETTSQTVIDEDFRPKSFLQGTMPIQYCLVLKEHNCKKLNSHKWLFRAMAPKLNPKICVLIDVGTKPKGRLSLYNLWKSFDRNPDIGGACGEICVMMGKGCSKGKSFANPLISAQYFEYKMSNILDKSLESCFGYISVLPGAFSAYRWEALKDISHKEGPLVAYFKGENRDEQISSNNVFEANMYLAEDRILCLELVGKRKAKWLLHYCSEAQAETDVPSSVAEFISQRRRWLNGTFFCQVYAIAHLSRFWRTRHNFFRKLALTFEFLYIGLNLIFNWFAIANFYLAFYLLTEQAFVPKNGNSSKSSFFDIVRLLYVSIIIATFLCSLGNRPQGSKFIYMGSMIIFGLLMVYMLVIISILIAESIEESNSWILEGGTSRDVVISLLSTYGVFAVSSLINGQFISIMSCLIQYLLLLPSYINILNVYAFCNSHDVSWGTKGDNSGSRITQKMVKGNENWINQNKNSHYIHNMDSAELLDSYRRNAVLLSIRPEPIQEEVAADVSREDYYKNFRTWMVLAWVLSNGLLVAIVSSDRITSILIPGSRPDSSNPYMAFIMYFVATTSIIKLAGSIYYKLQKNKRGY